MNFYETSWFVDIVLGVIYVLLVACGVCAVWSAVRGRLQKRQPTADDRLGRKLAWSIGGLVAVVLLLTFVLASTKALVINGQMFDNPFWLRTSDMLIFSSLILLAMAIGSVFFGFFFSKFRK